jgi:prepilin-type N-terminal cleavage/methylation domain-containing protein
MRSQSGMSLAELTVVMVIAALVVTAAATYALPWLGREEVRGAVYQVQQLLQLARIQAVARNRDCQFRVDTGSRGVAVYDLNDPADAADDIPLHGLTLPAAVSFARPDAGVVVTLAPLGGNAYQATFAPDGSVAAGAGVLALQGGEASYLVTLYGAGGVRVERWDGASWAGGS